MQEGQEDPLLLHEDDDDDVDEPNTRSCLGSPRLRGKIGTDTLAGRTTSQEALWGVILTMGIASMRDSVLKSRDIEWYVLHFYCLWAVVSASMSYSTRFNDEDTFHALFWALFLVGMFFQITYLYHSLQGFCAATCFLYGLILLAHVRVAVLLPRARGFCTSFALSHLVAILLLGAMALRPGQLAVYERRLLWAHTLWEPLHLLLFVLASRVRKALDIFVSIQYQIHRFEGMNMLIIVCSMLFPLGLQGKSFMDYSISMYAVLLGNLYAIVLKFCLFDHSQHGGGEEPYSHHAIRRSRLTAVLFLGTYSLGFLSIALTGVGFLAAVSRGAADPDEPLLSENIAFARLLLTAGPCSTFAHIAFHKALHAPREPVRHGLTCSTLLSTSLLCLVPLWAELSILATMACVVALASACLVLQLVIGKVPDGVHNAWRWRSPRLIKDWHTLDETKGALITSQEHFFTVLVAVCVFQLNEDIRQNQDLELYVLRFLAFYGMIWASMTYASRFNDDDAAHKLIWSLFEFGLLLVLEGLTMTPEASGARFSLFKVASCGVYLFLALCFFGRVASSLERARPFALSMVVVHSISAVLLLIVVFLPSMGRVVLWIQALWVLLADVVFITTTATLLKDPRQLDLPMNVEYIIHRFNGLCIEVLGVAAIVPSALYPGSYRPELELVNSVFGCCCLAALIALSLKAGLVDVDPVDPASHAIRQSRPATLAFLALFPLTLLGVALTGAAIPQLIIGTGTMGTAARSMVFQRLLAGAACLTWGSLTVTKCLHRPSTSATVHRWKAAVQGTGTLFLLGLCICCGFAEGISDFAVLGLVAGTSAVVALTQLLLTAYAPKLEWSRAPITS